MTCGDSFSHLVTLAPNGVTGGSDPSAPSLVLAQLGCDFTISVTSIRRVEDKIVFFPVFLNPDFTFVDRFLLSFNSKSLPFSSIAMLVSDNETDPPEFFSFSPGATLELTIEPGISGFVFEGGEANSPTSWSLALSLFLEKIGALLVVPRGKFIPVAETVSDFVSYSYTCAPRLQAKSINNFKRN
jgi:hypothetical protein